MLIALAGCFEAPSKSSKGADRWAIIKRACSEIASTRNFESSTRARIWNDAVDKLGQSNYYDDTEEFLLRHGGGELDSVQSNCRRQLGSDD